MMIKLLIFLVSFSMASALQLGFYNSTCPQAESIVRDVVQSHFSVDPSVTPAFIRLHFHDCWVNGCDASILINSTKDNKAEKDNPDVNRTIRGYNIIDEIKSKLEAACPSTVSCADIIPLAVRDAVALAGGLNYSVPTGRRDGLKSSAQQAVIPTPEIDVDSSLELFNGVLGGNYSMQDMVVLLGAHTVGRAHCGEFQDRLSDTANLPMDPVLRARLIRLCNVTVNSTVGFGPATFLDQATPLKVDNEYYVQILRKRGIMEIDQALAVHPKSGPIVELLSKDKAEFNRLFAKALVKLGKSFVLEGTQGEIRKQCGAVNTPSN